MDATIRKDLERYASADYHPVTFLERGVAVPFTTPMLLGTRVRPAGRGGLELVVPNPAGDHGYYIFPWQALPEFCQPTVHDRLLLERMKGVRAPTPAAIRDTARQIAVEGHAGHANADAARQAIASDNQGRVRTNFRLLMRLVRQTEGSSETAPWPESDPSRTEFRASRAAARASKALLVKQEAVAAALEGLAGFYAPIGDPGDSAPARVCRQVDELAEFAEDLTTWGAAREDPHDRSRATLVVRAARLTLRCTRNVVARLRAPLDNMVELMRRWQGDAENLTTEAVRPDWLLDGWGTLVGIWNHAEPSDRSAALDEIANIVPVLPREVHAWIPHEIELEEADPGLVRRRVKAAEDWRTGQVFELVLRNEMLVADFIL